MRLLLLEAEDSVDHFEPPPFSGCDRHSNCSNYRSYSTSRHFEANAAIVIILLLCALICALALKTAISCFLHRGSYHSTADRPLPQTHRHHGNNDDDHHTKTTQLSSADALAVAAACPTLVFTAGMKPKLAGSEAECPICLCEFVEGEGIRMMGRCKHGFHVECIKEWLSLHSSCPTCRRSCLCPLPFSSERKEEDCNP